MEAGASEIDGGNPVMRRNLIGIVGAIIALAMGYFAGMTIDQKRIARETAVVGR